MIEMISPTSMTVTASGPLPRLARRIYDTSGSRADLGCCAFRPIRGSCRLRPCRPTARNDQPGGPDADQQHRQRIYPDFPLKVAQEFGAGAFSSIAEDVVD
jgi:hypothetical protein